MSPMNDATQQQNTRHVDELELLAGRIIENEPLDTHDELFAAMKQVYELGKTHGSEPEPLSPYPGYRVRWEIDDTEDSETPVEAAKAVWFGIFERDEPGPDDACFFKVIETHTGTTHYVDLSDEFA